ncbi:MAG: hypothetical protein QMD77_00065 [Patescibacteria group bacterium]|nr:hypothetical protein [Patescibacteria group bacterium]
MAQKRMLSKSISLSAQVNKLNLKEKILFTWSIPHLDDYGLLDSDPEVIKATVCPMIKDITIKDIKQFVNRIEVEKLCTVYQDCIEFLGFENHQSISAEKRSKMKFQKIPKISQENSGKNNNPQKSPLQDKRSKEKIREEKESAPSGASSLDFLKNIPKDDEDYFIQRFDLSVGQLRNKAESLFLYCEAKGKTYRNYRSFLLNAVKKDFPERPPAPKPKEPEIPISEEDRKKNMEKLAEIRKNFKGKIKR